MIGFDEAAEHIAAIAAPLGSELVELGKASGRVLAEPVIAAVDSPPADVSTMDGYAVREADLAQGPARLEVVRENLPGAADCGTIAPGQCARIFTGATLPAGADRVVIQEVVVRVGPKAGFERAPEGGRNLRRRGADFAAGAVLLDAGVLLGPRQLVVAAASDRSFVPCWRRPRVRLISTGDELAEPGSARRRPGAIPESISFGIAALVEGWGGDLTGKACVEDSLAELELAAHDALGDCDLLVVTGGASAGERDFAKDMFAPFGFELLFAKVAIKPGKPVWLGRAGDKPVLGLPGNPTSAMVTGRLFLAPLVAGLAGRSASAAWQWRGRLLAAPLPRAGEREEFVRGRVELDETVAPVENQDSGAQHALAGADVLIRRPAHDQERAPGTPVPTIDF